MKKTAALLSALLLTSSLVTTACGTNNAGQGNNAGQNNTTGQGGTAGTKGTAGDGTASRINNNMTGGTGVTGGRPGPSATTDRVGTTGTSTTRTGTAGTGTTTGMNSGAGTTTGQNPRSDRSLESRVEALPGVGNAAVMVAGNSAFVMVNQVTGRGTTGAGMILSSDMRTRIASEITGTNPAIRNVYFVVR